MVVKCAHLYCFFLLLLFTLKYTSLIYTAYLRTFLYRDKMSLFEVLEEERVRPARLPLIILVECLEFLLQTKNIELLVLNLPNGEE